VAAVAAVVEAVEVEVDTAVAMAAAAGAGADPSPLAPRAAPTIEGFAQV